MNAGTLDALAALEVLPFDSETLWRAVEQGWGVRLVESNRRAFGLGGEAAGSRGTVNAMMTESE